MKKASTTLPKSNAKTAYGLLSEIRALILAEPMRYHQGMFILRHGEDDGLVPFPACGTVGCVAGWVATLKHPRRFAYDRTHGIAQRILGLDRMASSELFAGGAAGIGGQTPEHAKAGAAHIRHFQQKYKAQLLAKHV